MTEVIENNKVIDMNLKYKTLEGLSVRVLCTDVKSEYSVVAAVMEKDGTETICSYTKEGLFYVGCSNKNDIVEVSPYEDFKVDDLCVVTDYSGNRFFRYFANEIEGVAYCFPDGRTSVTVCNELIMQWPLCRKATPEEIQTRTINKG